MLLSRFDVIVKGRWARITSIGGNPKQCTRCGFDVTKDHEYLTEAAGKAFLCKDGLICDGRL